ncbi:MAG: hypothetical protein KTR14_00100 [Vampirovibrio sp.]|nr:hypothetical protein [Vampirovibrio sp.]
MISQQIELTGHLIDSLTLAKVLDVINAAGGEYTLDDIQIGSQKQDFSLVQLTIEAPAEKVLKVILDRIKPYQSGELTKTLTTPGKSPLGSPGTPKILMCPPDHFTVAYAINPWMSENPSAGGVDVEKAKFQWDALYQALTKQAGAQIYCMDPVEGLPDLVFTANAAFVYGNKAVIARYKFPERQGEEIHDQHWFEAHGFDTFVLPKGIVFEGAGDALIWESLVFAGYKTRTDIASHGFITAQTGLPVLSMELVNPSFYHIDVCLCPLSDGHLIYYPGAFDPYGLAVIESQVPENKRVPVTAEEAARFACNAVNVNDTIVLNQGSPRLEEELKAKGFQVVPVDMSEFIKSGGSAKCLTLRIG